MSQTEDVIFALRPGSIEVNDIVLTSDFGTVRSVIRKFTRSDFSHAALCTRPEMLCEAVPEGVMRRSVLGTFAPRREWIAVLRPRKPLPQDEHGLRVADYAEALYGRAYSRRGAVASRVPIVGAPGDGSVFCSQVIAQAFQDYGVALVPGKLPAQVYPGLLFDSPELVDVTEGCIRELCPINDADHYRQVVDTARHELRGAEMQMNRKVFEAVQKALGPDLPTHVYSLTDLAMWLGHEFNSEVVQRSDAKILSTFEGQGMFTWYDAFSGKVQGDAAVLESAAKAAEAIASEPWTDPMQAFLDDVIAMNARGDGRLEDRKTTAQDYDALVQRTGLKTFARLRDEYRRQYDDARRIREAQERLVNALRQRKAGGTA